MADMTWSGANPTWDDVLRYYAGGGLPSTFRPSDFSITPGMWGGGDTGAWQDPVAKYAGDIKVNQNNFAFGPSPWMDEYQRLKEGETGGFYLDPQAQAEQIKASQVPQSLVAKVNKNTGAQFKLVPDANGNLIPQFETFRAMQTNPDWSWAPAMAAMALGANYLQGLVGPGLAAPGEAAGSFTGSLGGGAGVLPGAGAFGGAESAAELGLAPGVGAVGGPGVGLGGPASLAAGAATPNVLQTGANIASGSSSWFSGLSDAAKGVGTFLKDNKELIGAGAALAGLAGAATSGQPSTTGQLTSVANDELAFQKQQWERLAPIYEQLLQDSLKGSQEDRARANEAWQFYTDTFKPVQARYAQDVMAYDSPDEIARREALAAGTAQSQIDSQRQQATREMARIGLSPERVGQQLIDDANAAALAKASAINAERNNTKLTGIGLRQTAAGFGNTIPQQGLAAAGSSRADQATAIGNINSQVGNRSVGVNTALNPLIAANNASTAAYNSRQGMWGNLVGAGLNLLISDERKKENIQPVDEEAALAGLEAIPVSKFDYKPGAGDGGTHIGPMAQDVRAQFGDRVAPGGVGIDPVTMNGVTIAAVKGLAKKVARLERRLGADGGGAREVDGGDLPSLSMIGLEAL